MESYIDWTGKTPGDTRLQPHPNASTSLNTPEQSSYMNSTDSRLHHAYPADDTTPQFSVERPSTFQHGPESIASANGGQLNPNVTPSISSPVATSNESRYVPSQPMNRSVSAQSDADVHGPNMNGTSQQQPGLQQTTKPQYNNQAHQSYSNPYAYANNVNPYNMPYAQQQQVRTTPIYTAYPGQMPNGGHYNPYPANHPERQQPMTNVNPHPQMYYQQPSAPTYMQPQQNYHYQRPEDALQRVHQQIWQPQYQYAHPQAVNGYNQWQQPPVGQTVYYPIEDSSAKKKPKIERPASPVRPTDPLGALRYDVKQCLTDYNTSRDLKGCATALLAIMVTCDPAVPTPLVEVTASASDNAAAETSSKKLATELDPKTKQITLLSVVSEEIKGAMIEEVSNNKSIRAKLRTWFVRAHKDNSYVVLKAIISVLDKLTFLSARLLAEVKFGKALVIVSRKCEDKDVTDALAKWVAKAEESLVVERELEVAASKAPQLEDEPRKKKAKILPSASTIKSASKSLSPPRTSEITTKNGESDKSKVAVKKTEPVAKTNTAFFKKDTAPVQKPLIGKPGLAAALAGIKARKKTDVIEADTVEKKVVAAVGQATKASQPDPATRVLPLAKPGFSALKLVEGLKRTASPASLPGSENELKKRKTRKSVSWRPEPELEQIRIFESLEPENGYGDVAQTPHEYGNARDLDRKEGAILHGGILPDREEDFIDWAIPKAVDFSHKDLVNNRESRGPKNAGTLKVDSKSNDIECEREKSAFLVIYNDESEIPWTPSEKDAVNDSASAELSMPKLIPLPFELRNDWRVQQVLGEHVYNPDAGLEDNDPLPTAPLPIEAPDSNVPATQPDIAAILAGLLASQNQGSAVPVPEVPLPMTTPAAGAAAAPPPPPMAMPPYDPKLAEFLAQMAATTGGQVPQPPSAVPSGGFPEMPVMPMMPPLPMMPNFPPQAPVYQHFDVRPWVKYNDGGKYRENCRFLRQGKCEKGDKCPYIHAPEDMPRR